MHGGVCSWPTNGGVLHDNLQRLLGVVRCSSIVDHAQLASCHPSSEDLNPASCLIGVTKRHLGVRSSSSFRDRATCRSCSSVLARPLVHLKISLVLCTRRVSVARHEACLGAHSTCLLRWLARLRLWRCDLPFMYISTIWSCMTTSQSLLTHCVSCHHDPSPQTACWCPFA